MRTDHLSRQPFIDILKNIIVNQSASKLGYSIAIDGDWGSGKTWILQEFESQLNKDYLTFHYNAWKNDFYEEPLVALLSVMIEKLNKMTNQKSLYDAAVNTLVNEVLGDFKLLVCGIIKQVAKIDIEKSISSKKSLFKCIKNKLKINNDINTLLPLRNTIKVVKENLIKLSNNFSIILVMDELDRCLPEYAIKVLERLHHICNEMPIIQIIAIDKSNLTDSICKVFGKNFDEQNPFSNKIEFVDLYLQKFIDISIPLPNGKPNKSLEIMNGLEKEFCPWIRKEPTAPLNFDEKFLEEFVSEMFAGIERRLQEKIFRQVELFHKMTLATGIKLELCSYAILIYEIISCIAVYVFHSQNLCDVVNNKNGTFSLAFKDVEFALNPYVGKYKKISENLKEFFCLNEMNYVPQGTVYKNFFISDEKSYLMKSLTNTTNQYNDFEQKTYMQFITEDKIFLLKYNEIMHIELLNS